MHILSTLSSSNNLFRCSPYPSHPLSWSWCSQQRTNLFFNRYLSQLPTNSQHNSHYQICGHFLINGVWGKVLFDTLHPENRITSQFIEKLGIQGQIEDESVLIYTPDGAANMVKKQVVRDLRVMLREHRTLEDFTVVKTVPEQPDADDIVFDASMGMSFLYRNRCIINCEEKKVYITLPPDA